MDNLDVPLLVISRGTGKIEYYAGDRVVLGT
jgi:hypothetical protein